MSATPRPCTAWTFLLLPVGPALYRRIDARQMKLELVEVYLQPGEMFLALEPTIIRTLLGSCVGVSFWSRRMGIGALCHAMLPQCPGEPLTRRAPRSWLPLCRFLPFATWPGSSMNWALIDREVQVKCLEEQMCFWWDPRYPREPPSAASIATPRSKCCGRGSSRSPHRACGASPALTSISIPATAKYTFAVSSTTRDCVPPRSDIGGQGI